MPQDAWSPAQYERFKRERSQPFHDLLALVRARPGMRVVDLGCGTGELTALLHEQLQAAETTGIDRSEQMLATSAKFARDGLRFVRQDIAEFAASGQYDLVFSNAALHWVRDHGALLELLTAALAPGGQLAVQLPAMDDHPARIVTSEVAARPPFSDALAGFAHEVECRAPEWYAASLHALGFHEQHVRLQVYPHTLPSREAVVDWFRGSLLTAYQARLSTALYEEFVRAYQTALMPLLPDASPFFFGFKRILFWGQR